MSEADYQFEMFDLRQNVLATVAKYAREDDLTRAKHEAKRMIRLRTTADNPDRVVKAFATSFDRAREFIEEDNLTELEIDPMPDILADHDAEIDPTHDIDGDPVEVITSIDRTGFGAADKSTYPVVAHPSGFRVCTCPSQRYHIVCKHTLARVIERNWPRAPVLA